MPSPGPQTINPATLVANHYFADEETWGSIVSGRREFDDIVCGSGFCALAYVSEALKRDPFRRILIIERGEFWLPDHFQNLPTAMMRIFDGSASTFPWTLSETTQNNELGLLYGHMPFFGGRSPFWAAWCPKPTPNLMRDFPPSMLESAADPLFWTSAEELLHVIPASEIRDPVFSSLQHHIDAKLSTAVDAGRFEGALFVEPARLAVGKPTSSSSTSFHKFATVGPLLELQEKSRRLARKGTGAELVIATGVVVEKFSLAPESDASGRKPVVSLQTARGTLNFPSGRTNVLLGIGALPATTMVMNSVGDNAKGRGDTRITGHVQTRLLCRFPATGDPALNRIVEEKKLQISGAYLAGQDPRSKLQYHVQVMGMHSPHPEDDAFDAAKKNLDYAITPTLDQLEGSEGHVLIVGESMLELSEKNPNSWVRFNPEDPDITTNVKVQLTLCDDDRNVWDLLDRVTFETIEAVADTAASELEYWHVSPDGDGKGYWNKTRPTTTELRLVGLGHEAGMLSVGLGGDGNGPAVDALFRPGDAANVHVLGTAVLPTTGAWNPTFTICAYALDLARKIVPARK